MLSSLLYIIYIFFSFMLLYPLLFGIPRNSVLFNFNISLKHINLGGFGIGIILDILFLKGGNFGTNHILKDDNIGINYILGGDNLGTGYIFRNSLKGVSNSGYRVYIILRGDNNNIGISRIRMLLKDINIKAFSIIIIRIAFILY